MPPRRPAAGSPGAAPAAAGRPARQLGRLALVSGLALVVVRAGRQLASRWPMGSPDVWPPVPLAGVRSTRSAAMAERDEPQRAEPTAPSGRSTPSQAGRDT